MSKKKDVTSGTGPAESPQQKRTSTKATKRRPPRELSTPSTPSTYAGVEAVEGVEAAPKKPKYRWEMSDGLDKNFTRLGGLLNSLGLQLFRHAEGGLLLVDGGDRIQRVRSAKELAPFLIDHVRLAVFKNSKYHGEAISDGILNKMLASRSFLDNFREVEEVVRTPIVLADFAPSQPGFNGGGVLHVGRAATPAQGTDTIQRFLDVMPWAAGSDRTNAVAALLTVPFRRHFAGGKPLVLVTATKSHAGKGTLIEFVQSSTAKADVLYEDKDWPMQNSLLRQLAQQAEVGVIGFDSVRTDSSGRAKVIRSGFLESFITNSEIVLSSPSSRSEPLRTANKFVVMLNTNEGALSIDLLNRSLPIRLDPKGDLTERIAAVKAKLGGDVKQEWLPANRSRIEAEMWGMIEKWAEAGRPLDESVTHPMGPWAKTIGGILRVNGFRDFLDNYTVTRAAIDPIRESLTVLAFHSADQPLRASELAERVIRQGLAKTLIPKAEPAHPAAGERAIGVLLSGFVGETFTARTATERITFRLLKEAKRWDDMHPHFRYTFREIAREQAAATDSDGLVLKNRRWSE